MKTFIAVIVFVAVMPAFLLGILFGLLKVAFGAGIDAAENYFVNYVEERKLKRTKTAS